MPRAKQRQKQGSETENVQRIRIDRLVRDDRLQFRSLDRGTVRRYAQVFRSEREMPPIKVAELNGALILVDGWHRVAALESIGTWDVDAVIEPVASQREADWLAAKANTEHGLPLKPKEYRKVFQAFVRAKKHRRDDGSFKSYREIAAEIGGARGHTTIRNWMQKDFPRTFRAMSGRDDGFDPSQDYNQPTVSLEGIVFEALKDARAAMPAVTDPDERGQVVVLLEEMLNEAKSRPWERPEF
jgi:ParB/Sulfiredoxin domain